MNDTRFETRIEILMFHGIVYYPEINTEKIGQFRRKYDPSYGLIGPHVTVVYGVDSSSISRQAFSGHVRTVLEHWKAFDVEFKGLKKSWDHWLFLTLGKGNEDVIRLHNELYTGILAPFLRRDIPYIPHIGLGEFVEERKMGLLSRKRLRLKKPVEVHLDEARYRTALEEAQNLNLSYSTKVDKLHVTEADEDYTTIEDIEVFSLGSNP